MFTKEFWKSSAEKLKSTKYLALMASFIAMKCIAGYFTIPIGENLRITFGYVIRAVECAILGPVAGMLSSAITDIVAFMLHPSGPFFIGYTLSEVAGAFFYAMAFYRAKITLPRIIIAKVLVNYLVNVLLGSVWSAILYSKGYIYYATKSLIKNTTMLPIEIALLYAAFRLLSPALVKRRLIIPQKDITPKH